MTLLKEDEMTQVRANPDSASNSRDWADLLRANCLTLTSTQFTRSVSLSRGFPHGAELERESFVDLAQRLAEEYGLTSYVESHGYYVTIRFFRQEPEAVEEVAESDSVLARAGTWLKARFGRDGNGSEEQS